MDVPDEMNQKREVGCRAPFVVVVIAKAPGILVDFGGDTMSARATGQQILPTIL